MAYGLRSARTIVNMEAVWPVMARGLPRFVPLTTNWTVPVGVPKAIAGLTVAVKVMKSPVNAEDGSIPMAVVVATIERVTLIGADCADEPPIAGVNDAITCALPMFAADAEN